MKMSVEPADLRVRRTHKLLWDALVAELSTRSYEDITVKDICARAMVHRTTFYKHYDDKDDLLARGVRQMFDAMTGEEEHLPPYAFSVERPPTYFVRLFEQAAQHQTLFRQLLRPERIGWFQRLVKKYVDEVTSAHVRQFAVDRCAP